MKYDSEAGTVGTEKYSTVEGQVVDTDFAAYYAQYYEDKNNNGHNDDTDKKVTVEFKTDGNGDFGTATTKYTNVLEKLTFEQAEIIVPVPKAHKGYTFDHWEPSTPSDATIVASDDMTFTAYFTDDANGDEIPDEKQFQLTFDLIEDYASFKEDFASHVENHKVTLGEGTVTYYLNMNEPYPAAPGVTIADGTAVKAVGDKILPYVQENVDDMLLVEDDELIGAFLDMVENHKMIVENSGLLSVAALKQLDLRGKKVVCILSGGNMDVITMSSIVQHGLIQRDRIFSVSVLLPDKPGELVQVAKTIADEQGNVIKLEHNQFVSTNRNAAVELRITMEAFGTEHKNRILDALEKNGFRPKLISAKLY